MTEPTKRHGFQTELAPSKSDACAGFAASGSIDPCTWADELYKGVVPGPWLCCYMLRRFGWPNAGSDDYKNLCSWSLTTPIDGLYLLVTPYLGSSNLHFAVNFNKVVQSQIGKDPGREAYFARRETAVLRWWNATGRKLYTIGGGTVEGDEDVLVHPYSEQDGKVWGLWKRTPAHAKLGANKLPAGLWRWLGQFVDEQHPKAKLPRITKREQAARVSRYNLRVKAAITATLKDLLRPTYVRDISFTPFGSIEDSPEAIERYSNQKTAEYFHGAGNTPEYWFTRGEPRTSQKTKKIQAVTSEVGENHGRNGRLLSRPTKQLINK